ncbi:hypothetical protein BEP19_15880 [Ammoniphilus oxalaticus]|uniref:Uncharacterized protein n=1 Tax=Ammoniphilus oxalaticus TaxID=66863 RepID=A0A419SQB7_9BACL|nr:hypothetical protein [Ammoniphilus oxalaticus]RKD26686.1 hypothetical protein BEP19_15880 [Ammoniphilus oxalaticus]
MITLRDIRIAINRQLAKTGIEINSGDIEEGFKRPSFFVQLDNVNRSGDESQVQRSLTVRIYYFPKDRYEYAIEVLDMQEKLEDIFDLKLRIKDRYINVDEYISLVNDGVLNVSFDIEFYDGRDIEWAADKEKEFIDEHPIEKMEELDFEKE